MYVELDKEAPSSGAQRTEYGQNVVQGLKKEERAEKSAVERLTQEQDHVLKSFRLRKYHAL